MEQEKAEKKSIGKKPSTKWGCLVFLFGFILLLWICGVFDKTETPSEPDYVTLKANVRFDGSQFIITNNDSFDWTNVELEVNGSLLKGGYKLKQGRMEAGTVYTVGALQFAKSDGTRLNPFTTKPQKFEIMCDTPKGRGITSLAWK